jgi:hypothetical protein
MTRLLLFLLTVFFLPCLGCSSPGLINILRVNVGEPEAYCASEDRCKTFRHNRELAEQAWASMIASDPSCCSSPYFQEGFIDGYADYLNLGGTGAAPPLPPRHYWNVDFKSPAGVEASQAWFAGFEAGAAAAKASGIREVEIVPSSLLLAPAEMPLAAAVAVPETPGETIVLPSPPIGGPRPEEVPTPAPMPANH